MTHSPIKLAFTLCLISFSTFSQTKIISHKSHSGNANEFNTAFANDLFDMNDDNLGVGYIYKEELTKENLHPQLDSVIFVSNQKTLLVTSIRCTRTMDENTNEYKPKSGVWNPGTETAWKHPLFSKQHALDSIKNVIKVYYSFENSVDDVVFVGFDNNKVTAAETEVNPVKKVAKKTNRKSRIPLDKAILVVLGISLATLFSGLFMLNKNN